MGKYVIFAIPTWSFSIYVSMYLILNKEHYTFYLKNKHSVSIAKAVNMKNYEELSYPKNEKMCDPMIANPVMKMQPNPAAHPH